MKKLMPFVVAVLGRLIASARHSKPDPARPDGNWEFIGEASNGFPYHYRDYINLDSIRMEGNIARYTMRTVYDPPIKNIDDILVAVDYVEYAIDCQDQARALVSIKSFNPEATVLINHAWQRHEWAFRKPKPGSAGAVQNVFICARLPSKSQAEQARAPLGNRGHAY